MALSIAEQLEEMPKDDKVEVFAITQENYGAGCERKCAELSNSPLPAP